MSRRRTGASQEWRDEGAHKDADVLEVYTDWTFMGTKDDTMHAFNDYWHRAETVVLRAALARLPDVREDLR